MTEAHIGGVLIAVGAFVFGVAAFVDPIVDVAIWLACLPHTVRARWHRRRVRRSRERLAEIEREALVKARDRDWGSR